MAYICEPEFAEISPNVKHFWHFFITEVVFQAFCLVAHTLSKNFILDLSECRSQTTKD